MTNTELSNQFDVMVNSYHRFKDYDKQELLDSIEFNEYEKSLYLTKAQEELILSLYNGRNSSLQSFEETEELRRYLSDLIMEAELSPLTSLSGKVIGIDSKSKFFTLPEGLWFITYEAVNFGDGEGPCCNGGQMEVVPVRQDEYHRLRKNPFRGTNRRRSLRFDLGEGNVEIVSKYEVSTYYIRYLSKPRPIILEDLPDGLSIGGLSLETPPEVHETLHQRILELAVQTAVQSKLGGYAPKITERDNNNRE